VSAQPQPPFAKAFGAIVGLAALAISFLVRALNGPPGFPDADRAAFTRTCRAGDASAAFCGCLLSHIEGRVSIEQFRRLDAQFRSTRQMPAVFAQDVQRCATDAGP